MSDCCYINADFDLSLRGESTGPLAPPLQRQVEELSLQALLGARPGDAALLREEAPDAFVDHLQRCGIAVPRLLRHPQIDPALRFEPFGWNAEAIELNARHDRPTAHPSPEVVRRLNSRSFQLELETEPVEPARSVEDIERLLASGSQEWIFKSEHGASGLANRRLRPAALSDTDRRFLADRLVDGQRGVLEPWRDRLRDFSAVFTVPFDAATLRVHETIGTRDGALIGAIFGEALPGEWTTQLQATAERVAGAMEREGYFGSVCMDAFSWRDGDRTRFRPLVDLNCRRAMLDRARRLHRELTPDRTLYYRFFNRRKLRLPPDLAEALSLMGKMAYSPASRRGALLATPTHFSKIGVGFFGSDRTDAEMQEQQFRAALERRGG